MSSGVFDLNKGDPEKRERTVAAVNGTRFFVFSQYRHPHLPCQAVSEWRYVYSTTVLGEILKRVKISRFVDPDPDSVTCGSGSVLEIRIQGQEN
jgi:hypothetical protein